jgi:hypothetical protein
MQQLLLAPGDSCGSLVQTTGLNSCEQTHKSVKRRLGARRLDIGRAIAQPGSPPPPVADAVTAHINDNRSVSY